MGANMDGPIRGFVKASGTIRIRCKSEGECKSFLGLCEPENIRWLEGQVAPAKTYWDSRYNYILYTLNRDGGNVKITYGRIMNSVPTFDFAEFYTTLFSDDAVPQDADGDGLYILFNT